jgi:pyruvate dehydrogenase E1 component beta subunit
VKRQGKDVTIVSYSRMVHVALSAAEKLAKDGIDTEVIDLRTLRPLDSDTVIESVKKTNRAVLLEEAWRTGGFMAEIASRIQEEAFDYLDGPVKRIAGKEVPLAYARNLELAAIPNENDVLEAVHEMMGR